MARKTNKTHPAPDYVKKEKEAGWVKWSVEPEIADASDRIWLVLDQSDPAATKKNLPVRHSPEGQPRKNRLHWWVVVVFAAAILVVLGVIFYLRIL